MTVESQAAVPGNEIANHPSKTGQSEPFTPGPWAVVPSIHGSEYLCVQIGSDKMYTTTEILPADARLIAAAPDLFATLTALLRLYRLDTGLQNGDNSVTAAAHNAIAKATS